MKNGPTGGGGCPEGAARAAKAAIASSTISFDRLVGGGGGGPVPFPGGGGAVQVSWYLSKYMIEITYEDQRTAGEGQAPF